MAAGEIKFEGEGRKYDGYILNVGTRRFQFETVEEMEDDECSDGIEVKSYGYQDHVRENSTRLTNGIVTLAGYEHCEECHFNAYYDPAERWNGWLMPYFKIMEVSRLAVFMREECYEKVRYDGEADMFIFVEGDWTEGYHGVDIDGMHLYPIGAGSWVWIEA